MDIKAFIEFSKPFLEGTKETFKIMMDSDLKVHSPSIKVDNKPKGEITSLIGMNGTVHKEGKDLEFKGLIAFSFSKEVYLKMASAMLMQEYDDFCEDIEDTGSEIANIVMGNAKKVLAEQGYKIGMSSPTTIKGIGHEIKYPSKNQVIETIISSEFGDFSFEICYSES